MSKKIILAIILIVMGSCGCVCIALADNSAKTQVCSREFTVKNLVDLTNKERDQAGLSLLKENGSLDKAAQMKLDDMIKLRYFGHENKYGTKYWMWVSIAGYRFDKTGENLAVGYYDARRMVAAWMSSPSHRANILYNKYEDVGFAVGLLTLEDGSRGIAVVQEFGTSSSSNLAKK
jgi:uncharacterized protein YkwD